MLAGLFGNQNVARILLFLFVNEKCYAAQIQSLLGVPLTPLQQGLSKLEKEKIIYSHYEGRKRIYQFNPQHPFRCELDVLLKKAYTLLSPHEKKNYCFIHRQRLSFKAEVDREGIQEKALLSFWKRLTQVRHLFLSTQSRQEEQTVEREGKAEVHIQSLHPSTVVFQEKGHWLDDQSPETAFSNSFRWTLDIEAFRITLEHLRYGAKHPVFLFHLTPIQPHLLEPVDAHLCGEDTYLGNVVWNRSQIDFHWRIIGPFKNDHLTYRYT